MNTTRTTETHRLRTLGRWLGRFLTGPRRHLDARDLSDHMKRDMGFLDGNAPGRRR